MPSKDRGGKRGGGKTPQERDVTISKALSFVLRHGGKAAGVELDEGGWANVRDVLAWPRLASQKVTFKDLERVVASNDKKRFALIPNPSPEFGPSPHTPDPSHTEPSHYLIRAVQGHSVASISTDKLLTPILPTDPDCPQLVVHGTYPSSWSKIEHSDGLKAMTRRHIHFARGLPPALPPLKQYLSKPPKDERNGAADGSNSVPGGGDVSRPEEVISGMRRDASVLVWVDVKGSMEAGMKWWRAANGVVLTEGLEGKVGMNWVVWAERRGVGEVIYGDKERGFRMREAAENGTSEVTESVVEEVNAGAEPGRTVGSKDEEHAFVREALIGSSRRTGEVKIRENWDDSGDASPAS
ncbi:MAG: hypothetical protein Q9163_001511 [Psora crenata]